MDSDKAIAGFWGVFLQHEEELLNISSADHPIYDLILQQLQLIDPGLYFEFSSDPVTSELIITAEGDQALFSLVETVVAAAPRIPGWSVLALKPKLGFPVCTTWEDVTVNLADVVFDPLERPDSGELGLRMFVPGLSSEYVEHAHNALLRALDHGLGERAFAELIGFMDVCPLPEDASLEDHIPLTDLEDYINWREKDGKGMGPAEA